MLFFAKSDTYQFLKDILDLRELYDIEQQFSK